MPRNLNKGFALIPILVLLSIVSLTGFAGYRYFYNNDQSDSNTSESEEEVLAATNSDSDVSNFVFQTFFGVKNLAEFNKISSPLILSGDTKLTNCTFLPRSGSSFSVSYASNNKINTAQVFPNTSVRVMPNKSDESNKYLAVVLNSGSVLPLKDAATKVTNTCNPALTLVSQSGDVNKDNFFNLITTQPSNNVNDGQSKALITINKAPNGSVEFTVKPLNTFDNTKIAIYNALKRGISINRRPVNGNEISTETFYPVKCNDTPLKCSEEFKFTTNVGFNRFVSIDNLPKAADNTQYSVVDNIKNSDAKRDLFQVIAKNSSQNKDVVEFVFTTKTGIDSLEICKIVQKFGIYMLGTKQVYKSVTCSESSNSFSVLLSNPPFYSENLAGSVKSDRGLPFVIPFNSNNTFTYSVDKDFPKFGPRKFDVTITKGPGLNRATNEVVIVTITPKEESSRRNMEIYNYFKTNGIVLSSKTGNFPPFKNLVCNETSDCSKGFKVVTTVNVESFKDFVFSNNSSFQVGSKTKNFADMKAQPVN